MKYSLQMLGLVLMSISSLNGAFRSPNSLVFDAEADRSTELTLTSSQATFSTNVSFEGHTSLSFSHYSNSGNIGSEAMVLVNTASDNVSLELPNPTDFIGRYLQVKKTELSNSANLNVTYASGNVDTFTLSSGNQSYLELYSDGSQWIDLQGTGYTKTAYINPLNYPVFWLPMNEGPSGTLTEAIHGLTPQRFDSGISWVDDRDSTDGKYALGFSGATSSGNSFCTIPYHSSMAPSANTSFCAWVKFDSWNVSRTILRLYDNSFANNEVYEIYLAANNATNGRFKFEAAIEGNTAENLGTIELENDLATTTNTWLFLVVTTTNSSVKFYAYDGDPVPVTQELAFSGFQSSIAHGTGSAQLRIGAPYDTGIQAMELDDLRIYDFTLNDDQVQSIYEAGPQ